MSFSKENAMEKSKCQTLQTVRQLKAAGLGVGLSFLYATRTIKAAGLSPKAAGCGLFGLFRPPALLGLMF